MASVSQIYSWDKRNRLITSGTKSYSYDATGKRYKVIDSSSATPYTYYLNQYEELRNGTTTSAGTPTYYIFAGSQRVASLEGSTYTYYHQDNLDGTAVATDSHGAVSEYYDYYPYGSTLTSTQLSSTAAKHTFTDKEYDSSAGLFYFEARWMNPSTGRFVSEDPMQYIFDPKGKTGVTSLLRDPQSFNMYSYSRNNPLIHTDPTGKIWSSPSTWDVNWTTVGVGVLETALGVGGIAEGASVTYGSEGIMAGVGVSIISEGVTGAEIGVADIVNGFGGKDHQPIGIDVYTGVGGVTLGANQLNQLVEGIDEKMNGSPTNSTSNQTVDTQPKSTITSSTTGNGNSSSISTSSWVNNIKDVYDKHTSESK